MTYFYDGYEGYEEEFEEESQDVEVELSEDDKAMGIVRRVAFGGSMPFDAAFEVDGNDELCHATGDEVLFADDDRWYIEYVDSNGDCHYC